MNSAVARAIKILRVAAEALREQCAEITVHYDDAECDGFCLGDDCEIAADMLEDAFAKKEARHD